MVYILKYVLVTIFLIPTIVLQSAVADKVKRAPFDMPLTHLPKDSIFRIFAPVEVWMYHGGVDAYFRDGEHIAYEDLDPQDITCSISFKKQQSKKKTILRQAIKFEEVAIFGDGIVLRTDDDSDIYFCCSYLRQIGKKPMPRDFPTVQTFEKAFNFHIQVFTP